MKRASTKVTRVGRDRTAISTEPCRQCQSLESRRETFAGATAASLRKSGGKTGTRPCTSTCRIYTFSSRSPASSRFCAARFSEIPIRRSDQLSLRYAYENETGMNQEKERGSKKRHGHLIEAGRLGYRRNRASLHSHSLRAYHFARRLSKCLGRETTFSRLSDLSHAAVRRLAF